jgi:hypothetical protein
MRQERVAVGQGVARAELDEVAFAGFLGQLALGRLVGLFLLHDRLLRLSRDSARRVRLGRRARLLRLSDGNGQPHRKRQTAQARQDAPLFHVLHDPASESHGERLRDVNHADRLARRAFAIDFTPNRPPGRAQLRRLHAIAAGVR